jgi:Family of unknown function (DUF6114)
MGAVVPTEDREAFMARALSVCLGLVSFTLILAEGWYVAQVAGSANTAGVAGVGTLLFGVAGIGVMCGFLGLLFTFVLYLQPSSHLPVGIAVTTFALLSYFGGGGFLVGLILGVIAGVFAMLPRSTDTGSDRPLLAYAVALIGGALILLEGWLALAASGAASTVGLSSAAAALTGMSGVGLWLGTPIVLLAMVIYVWPSTHRVAGIGVILLSLGSFFGGGGFYIGMILGVAGGILAVTYEEYGDLEDVLESPQRASRPDD